MTRFRIGLVQEIDTNFLRRQDSNCTFLTDSGIVDYIKDRFSEDVERLAEEGQVIYNITAIQLD